VGDDDIVTEPNVDDYTEYGLVKSTINYDDDSAFEDDEVPQDMNYFRDKNGRPGRALMDGGPQRPSTEGMTKASADHTIRQWRKARKKWTDALAAQKNKRRRSMPVLGEESDSDDGIEYTGESIPTLRQMRDVETKPLCVGHNFKYKETCLSFVLLKRPICIMSKLLLPRAVTSASTLLGGRVVLFMLRHD